MYFRKNRAFTLIELSIVMVIIGLLIASISGASNLIRNAKLSNIIKEISSLKAAIDVFEVKYGELPGDFSGANSLWSDCANGGGNGELTAAEGKDAVAHMYYADILPKSPVKSATKASMTNVCTEGQYYLSDTLRIAYYLDGLANVLSQDIPNDAFGTTELKRSFIVLAGIDTSANTTDNQSALETKDAHHIDRKMDDGIPNKGYVAGHQNGNQSTCLASATTYDLDVEGKICTLTIRFR